MIKISHEVAGKIYDILIAVCGAHDDRDDFVSHMCERDCEEYRFQGSLGFGGKLYRNHEKVYVGYYPEDETPKRKYAAEYATKLIDNLFPKAGEVSDAKSDVDEGMGWKFLPEEELAQALVSTNRSQLIIGGYIRDEYFMFMRGDSYRGMVPLATFTPSGTTSPDFDRLEFADYGHTVRFGEYEAAADFISEKSKKLAEENS